MMDCCMLCYSKYLNTDGTLDRNALTDVLTEAGITEEVFQKNVTEPGELGNILRGNICMCDCHKKGMTVLH